MGLRYVRMSLALGYLRCCLTIDDWLTARTTFVLQIGVLASKLHPYASFVCSFRTFSILAFVVCTYLAPSTLRTIGTFSIATLLFSLAF